MIESVLDEHGRACFGDKPDKPLFGAHPNFADRFFIQPICSFQHKLLP
jgi:hypothetical protein